MVPLALLGAAITLYFTRNHYVQQAETQLEEQVKELKPVFDKLTGYREASRWPLYRGLLAQAEQALANGNALAARQHLLSEPATSAIADLRGFEWGYLWNKLNGERQQLEGHTGTITAVSLSADGKLAASASADGTVRLWNLDKGLPAAEINAGR